MEKNYVIICDSTADFELGFENPNIKILKTPVTIGEGDFTDSSPDHFYGKTKIINKSNAELKKKGKSQILIKTSSPTIGLIEDAIVEVLESGRDAIYACMSSTLSSTYECAAHIAVDDINDSEEYKNRAICIDTLCMSAATALLLRLAVEHCDTTEEVISYIYDRRNDTEHLFCIEDCTALRSSGRVSGLEMKLIDLFGIKPLMSYDFNEEGVREAKHIKLCHSVKGACAAMTKRLQDNIEDNICVVVHAQNPDASTALVNTIRKAMPELKILSGPEFRIGPAVGVHLGYSCFGLLFMRKKGVNRGAELHRERQEPETSYYGLDLV